MFGIIPRYDLNFEDEIFFLGGESCDTRIFTKIRVSMCRTARVNFVGYNKKKNSMFELVPGYILWLEFLMLIEPIDYRLA
jgi:hypothetical protein